MRLLETLMTTPFSRKRKPIASVPSLELSAIMLAVFVVTSSLSWSEI